MDTIDAHDYETDDQESLVLLVLYANNIDIEKESVGFGPFTTPGHRVSLSAP